MINIQTINRIMALINKSYGKPRAFKKTDPIDELVRTVLSQNTSDVNSLAAFDLLKRGYRRWEELLLADTREIAVLIKHAGLANIKAGRIKDVLLEIRRREGSLSLACLKSMNVNQAIIYLRSLKGVGPKTAACVLLFSFGMPVMPVDTHIYRVTGRLGLIPKGLGIEEAHDLLTRIVPKGLIYDFHLGIIEHGRKTCKAQNPKCGACLLYSLCKFKDKALYKKRGNN